MLITKGYTSLFNEILSHKYKPTAQEKETIIMQKSYANHAMNDLHNQNKIFIPIFEYTI